MKSKLKKAKEEIGKMPVEKVEEFLKRKSSDLSEESTHTSYLCDESGISYMTSIYGSGLSVVNNKEREVSEEIHLKAKAIMANAQHYKETELMFVYAYDALYYYRANRT